MRGYNADCWRFLTVNEARRYHTAYGVTVSETWAVWVTDPQVAVTVMV